MNNKYCLKVCTWVKAFFMTSASLIMKHAWRQLKIFLWSLNWMASFIPNLNLGLCIPCFPCCWGETRLETKLGERACERGWFRSRDWNKHWASATIFLDYPGVSAISLIQTESPSHFGVESGLYIIEISYMFEGECLKITQLHSHPPSNKIHDLTDLGISGWHF